MDAIITKIEKQEDDKIRLSFKYGDDEYHIWNLTFDFIQADNEEHDNVTINYDYDENEKYNLNVIEEFLSQFLNQTLEALVSKQ